MCLSSSKESIHKENTNFWTNVKKGMLTILFPKKSLDKIFRVGRSDMVKYGDGRDLFPMVWKGFLYILGHP